MHQALTSAFALILLLSHQYAFAQPPLVHEPTPIDRANWINAFDYQPDPSLGAAVRVVGFSLTVDARGMPTGCSVSRSSGKSSLDELTCRVLLKKAHFVSAKDRNGNAVPSTYASVIRYEGINDFTFDLSSPPEAASKHEQGLTNVRVTFGVRGTAPGCEITNSSGFVDLDTAACAIFEKMDPLKMPTKKVLAVEINWKLPTNPPVQEH